MPLTSTYILQVEKTGTSTGVQGGLALDGLIQLMPNPASEETLLTWPASLQVWTIELIAADGRRAATFSPAAHDHRMTLDLNGLAPGSFVVRATTSQWVWTDRLVKVPR